MATKFKSYVTPDLVEKALAARNAPPEQKPIEFVFASISVSNLDVYVHHLDTLTKLARRERGFIHSSMPVFAVTFGDIVAAPDGARRRLVEAAGATFPDSVCIVHGAVTAFVGFFGQLPGFWWPGLPDYVSALTKLRPGEVKELVA